MEAADGLLLRLRVRRARFRSIGRDITVYLLSIGAAGCNGALPSLSAWAWLAFGFVLGVVARRVVQREQRYPTLEMSPEQMERWRASVARLVERAERRDAVTPCLKCDGTGCGPCLKCDGTGCEPCLECDGKGCEPEAPEVQR
jgi:hypothetical protein